MKMAIFAILGGLFIFFSATVCAANVPLVGLEIYSDMQVNKEEGEVNGLQVILIPSDEGDQLLWRTGNGRVDKSLLLDFVRDKDVIKVTVPDSNDEFGEWTLTLNKTGMHAVGPRDLHHELLKVH